MEKYRFSPFFRAISSFVIIAFCLNSIGPIPQARAQLILPASHALLPLSSSYDPLVIRGIKLFQDNPLKFDFIIDPADSKLKGEELKTESTKLIKYFLATLTTPKEDLWVNLSPYEKDRIIPKAFGTTEMGRDLLTEDYILKQLTSSLMYPEDELGKKFWDKIYEEAYKKYGVTNIPVDTFNKVWILPDKAVVYENGDTAFVTESHLKVMLEEDYRLSSPLGERTKVRGDLQQPSPYPLPEGEGKTRNDTVSDVIREIILPAIEKEVNEGKHFAKLRQIYNSMILATWFMAAGQ